MHKEILNNEFYSDGRGPELQRAVWHQNGVKLVGFEYYNPDVEYNQENLCHLRLIGVEAFSMASDEVHGEILAKSTTNGAIFEVTDSAWLKSLKPAHVTNCKHYQIMFYDESFDIICEEIVPGRGKLTD